MGKRSRLLREFRGALTGRQTGPNSEESEERQRLKEEARKEKAGKIEAQSGANAAWANDQSGRGHTSQRRRGHRRSTAREDPSASRSEGRETSYEQDTQQERPMNYPGESPINYGTSNANFSGSSPNAGFSGPHVSSRNEVSDQRVRSRNEPPSPRPRQESDINSFVAQDSMRQAPEMNRSSVSEITSLENKGNSFGKTEPFEPELHDTESRIDWNMILENLYPILDELRHGCPSPRFDALVTNLRSPADIEVTMKIVIQAYKDATWGRQEVEQTLKKLETSFKSLQIESEKTLSQRTWKLNEDIAQIQRKHQREIGILEGRLLAVESHFNSQEHRHEDQMNRLRGEHQREGKAQADEHDLQRQRLKSQLTLLKNKTDTDMKALRDRHEQEKYENKIAAEQELVRIRSELERRLHDTQQSLSSVAETHRLEIAAINRRNEDERFRISQDFAIETNQLERNHALKLDQMVANYENEKKALVADLRNAKSQYDKRLGEMSIQLEQEIEGRDRRVDALKAEYESEKTEMRASHEKEKISLTRGLQESVEVLKGALVKRDHFKAMSDHELSYRFQEISSEVDDLARIRWDQRQVSTWPFPDQSLQHSENERRMKQYLIQNTLWVILYERVFCTPFRVLGEEGKALERDWIHEFGSDSGVSSSQILGPRPTKESEVWRYETMKKCVEATSQASGGVDPKNALKRDYERSVTETVQELFEELGKVSAVSSSEKQRMGDLVRKAAKLWMEIGQQRYRMFVLMSDTDIEPTRSRFEAVNRDGKLGLVVIPELRRMGNAQGEKLDKNELIMDCKGKFSVFSTN
ncbi:hypothetical protein BKA65DRAFT_504248 [Rhexocercosporidium sp. MPI-PUGE-AT-0058]|nr:hypothetical protein BKA65DRAFT_504248 [Rhexocercosporidium sp. MPI-PUGE-AT-0058]